MATPQAAVLCGTAYATPNERAVIALRWEPQECLTLLHHLKIFIEHAMIIIDNTTILYYIILYDIYTYIYLYDPRTWKCGGLQNLTSYSFRRVARWPMFRGPLVPHWAPGRVAAPERSARRARPGC